jgi:hypothetical protein
MKLEWSNSRSHCSRKERSKRQNTRLKRNPLTTSQAFDLFPSIRVFFTRFRAKGQKLKRALNSNCRAALAPLARPKNATASTPLIWP